MADLTVWREVSIYASHDTVIEEVSNGWRVTLPLWMGKSRLHCIESPLFDREPPAGTNPKALTILSCRVQDGSSERELVLDIRRDRVMPHSGREEIAFGISCYEMTETLRYLEFYESRPHGDVGERSFSLEVQEIPRIRGLLGWLSDDEALR